MRRSIVIFYVMLCCVIPLVYAAAPTSCTFDPGHICSKHVLDKHSMLTVELHNDIGRNWSETRLFAKGIECTPTRIMVQEKKNQTFVCPVPVNQALEYVEVDMTLTYIHETILTSIKVPGVATFGVKKKESPFIWKAVIATIILVAVGFGIRLIYQAFTKYEGRYGDM